MQFAEKDIVTIQSFNISITSSLDKYLTLSIGNITLFTLTYFISKGINSSFSKIINNSS